MEMEAEYCLMSSTENLDNFGLRLVASMYLTTYYGGMVYNGLSLE